MELLLESPEVGAGEGDDLMLCRNSILYNREHNPLAFQTGCSKLAEGRAERALPSPQAYTSRGASDLEPPPRRLAQHLGFYHHCWEWVRTDPLLVPPNFFRDWTVWYALAHTVFFVAVFCRYLLFRHICITKRNIWPPKTYFYMYRFQSFRSFCF